MFKPILITIVLFASIGLAGTIDPSVPDQKHLDYAEGFECVVKIEGPCKCGKDHMYTASGVAISPEWVLTAAHVVKESDKISVVVGENTFKVLEKIVHEEFDEKKIGYKDIALCRCEGNFDLNFYPELYEDSDEVSKIVSIAGFGHKGTFSTGDAGMDGKKRAGSNRISRTERDVLVCGLTDGKTSLEFLIAPGDSGGGLFIKNKLAGINSFVLAADGKTDSDYGDECAHTRVSQFAPWIKSKIKKD